LKYPDTLNISVSGGLSSSTPAASGGFKRTTLLSGTGTVSWT